MSRNDTPKRVPCTCTFFACKEKVYRDETGLVQPGKLVALSTRSRHNQKDREAAGTNVSEFQRRLILRLRQDDDSPIESDMGDEAIHDIATIRNTLFTLSCTLVAWLHLVAGLSWAATGHVLKVMQIVVRLAMLLGALLASSSLASNSLPSLRLPRDVRTAIKALSIEPVIIRSICCPKCFKQYKLESLPEICLRRETPRSKPCLERLWTTRVTARGPERVPQRLYSTQSFEDWLGFFLSHPGIEDLIDKSYQHQPTPVMTSIWDSPAWKSLGPFTSLPGNLTFSFFIDWFNPLTNKTAGKSVSCGAIMMFCLNLPFELQHLPENTYFAGITPPPKEPSVTTIIAVTDPIVDHLCNMWDGQTVRTHRHPEGVPQRVAVLPAIGDLLAMCKTLGFAGIASHNFCSFCKLRLAEIDNLDINSYVRHNGLEVLVEAERWKNSTTKKDRKELFQKSGVRWSSLNRLPYRDPVRHTVLGVMHNWLEGILQHQARQKWGIGVPINTSRESGHDTPPSFIDDFMIVDAETLEDELHALHEESQRFEDTPAQLTRARTESMILESLSEGGDDFGDDGDFEPDEDSSDEGEDLDGDEDGAASQCIFGVESLSKIRDCLSEAIIPTWIARPPKNLGEKSHGKQKADQWLTLFTVFLPLILPELWTASTPDNQFHLDLLTNFEDLVTCTNIVCAYSSTNAAADAYMVHYIRYRESSAKLFPNIASRPNHHYAMHNGELLKFWGPLIKLSEFPYEQHNGSLQKIKTNQHMWELDLTMLRQISRRGRLMALLRDSFYSATTTIGHCGLSLMAKTLFPTLTTVNNNTTSTTDIPMVIYERVLAYANKNFPSANLYRDFRHLPHPDNARILGRRATSIRHWKHNDREFSVHGAHPGNSSISFDHGGIHDAGFIEQIWRVPIDGQMHTLMVISLHLFLSPLDQKMNPYSQRPGLACQLVYSQRPPLYDWVVISPEQIIGHVAYYKRPPGSFGIQYATTVLVNSLHRYRDMLKFHD